MFLLAYCILLNTHQSVSVPATYVDHAVWNEETLPFYRTLTYQSPPMKGKDVVILQNLLRRYKGIKSLTANGYFDERTAHALMTFQKMEKVWPPNGALDPATARKVINLLISDGYKDDGVIPDNCKFKLYVPVHRDRTIETNATLYKCGHGGKILHVFTVRTRGGTGKNGHVLNQLTTNGDTPTGLSTLDLNSREPNATAYGPYPVLRVVKGTKGNVAIGRDNFVGVDGKDTFLSDYRSGILLHTGKWPGWDESKQMPNSNGCLHVHPADLEKIDYILTHEIGAIVNDNPFGKLPYPYKTQGIISVEEID